MFSLNRKKEKNKEHVSEMEEIYSFFYEKTKIKAEPRTLSWNEEEMIQHIDAMIRRILYVILLLSRKPQDNSLNMFFIFSISQKAGELMDAKSQNRKHELYIPIMSLSMEEGYVFLNGLKDTMQKAHDARRYCFKDEIRAIKDYMNAEWSSYKNNNIIDKEEPVSMK